jgi:uncharacterized DUF497 family protein
MASVPKLIWDDWNKRHFRKHNLRVKEVDETYSHELGRSKSYLARLVIYGKTNKGKLLAIVVSQTEHSNLYVVTARIMSKKERRLYYETKTN